MKNKLTELDVDFIGGQGPLTKEEEKKITEFLKNKKLLRTRSFSYRANLHTRKRVMV